MTPCFYSPSVTSGMTCPSSAGASIPEERGQGGGEIGHVHEAGMLARLHTGAGEQQRDVRVVLVRRAVGGAGGLRAVLAAPEVERLRDQQQVAAALGVEGAFHGGRQLGRRQWAAEKLAASKIGRHARNRHARLAGDLGHFVGTSFLARMTKSFR